MRTRKPATQVLHSVVMLRDATNARAYAAKALHALAKHAMGPFLRSLAASVDASGGGGGPLSGVLPKYISVWGGMDQKDAVVIGALAGVVMQVIREVRAGPARLRHDNGGSRGRGDVGHAMAMWDVRRGA